MLTDTEIERNRAVRIAYGHARRAMPWLADRWIEIAFDFAPPTPRQLAHLESLLSDNPAVSPDQLSLDELLTPTEEVLAA